MKFAVETIAVSIFAFFALLGAAFAKDDLFAAHMWVLFFVLAASAILLMRNASFGTVETKSDQSAYLDGPIRYGTIATVFWGVAGFLLGVLVAAQLAWPALNIEPYLTFGRLRPAHTSAVIFAFGGNALIATSFYVVQRTCRARLFGGNLAWFVFWGYQLFIVMAATGYLLGITQSREYAEPEWYVDLWLTIVWVAYLIVFLGTLFKRKEPHIYVANWFYLSFIVTIAMLHVVNNLAVPVSLPRNQELFGLRRCSGRADPVVVRPQRRRILPDGRFSRHDVLLHPQTGQPAGILLQAVDHSLLGADLPLHLGRPAPPALYGTARLGADARHGVFDHALDALMGWYDQRPDDAVGRLGQDPDRSDCTHDGDCGRILRHVDIRGTDDVDQGGQFSCRTIPTGRSGHVHSGALGWVGMISFGAIYFLVPKLWHRARLYSLRLVTWHIWLATLGIVVYAAVMWVAGIQQGLMWREYDDQGFLVYSFAESVAAMKPYYILRTLGGAMYLAGGLIMAWNIYMTILGRQREEAAIPGSEPAMQPAE